MLASPASRVAPQTGRRRTQAPGAAAHPTWPLIVLAAVGVRGGGDRREPGTPPRPHRRWPRTSRRRGQGRLREHVRRARPRFAARGVARRVRAGVQGSADDRYGRRRAGGGRPADSAADGVQVVSDERAHAPVRHARRALPPADRARSARRRSARAMVALARLPRPARRGGAEQAHALPPRAALLAREGSVLAQGPATAAGTRSSPLGAAASAIVGEVGPIPAGRLQALEAEGVPANAIVGVSGLELAADARLRGTPGGELLAVSGAGDTGPVVTSPGTTSPGATSPGTTSPGATSAGTTSGGRVVARASAHAGSAVRTTISPALQTAAVTALGRPVWRGDRDGTGQRAGSGGGGDRPGRAATAGLDVQDDHGQRRAGSGDRAPHRAAFPYATAATLDGVLLHNANGEECGGSLVEAFAVSCNSVFSPLGVKLGAARLVARRNGTASTTPRGSKAPLKARSRRPARSRANWRSARPRSARTRCRRAHWRWRRWRRRSPTAGAARSQASCSRRLGAATPAVRAISAATARTVRGMMLDVVRFGTGTAAAIPGVEVAGKTGTAELGTPAACDASSSEQKPAEGEEHSPMPPPKTLRNRAVARPNRATRRTPTRGLRRSPRRCTRRSQWGC